MQIDRKTLIEEEKLRNYIRKAIKKIQERRVLGEEQTKQDEDKLKSIIYKLIEADSNVAAPHRSTGINVLEDLLKKIIPQIEIEYKKLTTSPDQRASFRSHIVNAIQNSLAPVKISDKAGSAEEAEQAIDIGLEEATSMQTALSTSPDREDIAQQAAEKTITQQRTAKDILENMKVGEVAYLKLTSEDENLRGIKVITRVEDNQEGSVFRLSEFILQDRFSHSLTAMIEILSRADVEVMNVQEGLSHLNEEEEDIEVEVGDEEPGVESEEDFIDIDGEVEEPSEEEEKAQDFRIDGKDETGRNVAFRAFERIEQAVVDSYNILSDGDDRNLFFDYLITNIKLYFDKFEDEILTMLPEPTTPEYEQEKDAQLDPEAEDLGL